MDQTSAALALDFQQAAIGALSWETALERLAEATGSKNAELIGFGLHPFHLYSGLYDGALEAFAAAGGQELAVNSRIRVGLAAPELSVLDEADFTTDADCRRHPDYGAVIEALDIPFVCLTPLQKGGETQLGLAVMRSRRMGNIESEQKRLFAAAAPHVLNAVNAALVLERRAVSLVTRALDDMEEAGFVLDPAGRPRAWTPAGEALLRQGVLGLKGGRLSLRRGDDPSLQTAIAAAVSIRGVGDPAPRPVRAFDAQGLGFLIHVSPLPRACGFSFEVGALLIAKPPRALDATAAETARQLFGLTPSEAAVAGLLVSGLPAQAVAERQGVAVGTVRTHVRRILEKSGTTSQLEFLAAMASRL